MISRLLLPLGWICAVIFIVSTFVLGSLLQDYNPISQTISEIGQNGSPLNFEWQILIIAIAIMLMFFALGVLSFAKTNKLSLVPGIFLLSYGIAQFGSGFFPSPEPLHNVFGLSMTLGYFSPLAVALAWRNKLGKRFYQVSIFAFAGIVFGIFLNLSPAFAPSLYPLEYYGIVQRFLLLVFFAYLAYFSISTLNYSAGN